MTYNFLPAFVDAYNARTLSLPDVYTCVEQSSTYCSCHGSFFARGYVHSQNLSINIHSLASSDPLRRLAYRVARNFCRF